MSGEALKFLEWCAQEASEETCRRYERLKDCGDVCNSWCYKARLKWLRYLLWRGEITPQEYLLEHEKLRLQRRACPKRRQARQYDARIEAVRVAPGLEPLYRAAAESGVRVKHLWLVESMEPEYYQDGIVVFDVRRSFGQKRVNIIVLRYKTLVELLKIITSISYDAARKRVERAGATPLSYMRKIHWNLCLAACDRSICSFIEGRKALVEELHYTRYLEYAVTCTSRIAPLVDRVLSGEPLPRILAGTGLSSP